MNVVMSDIVIEVTRRCNMACKHCLRGEAENLDKMEAGRAHGFNRGVKGRGSEMNAMNLQKSH